VTVIGGRRNNSTAPPATSVAQTSRIREWLPAKHDCIVRCKHEKANNGWSVAIDKQTKNFTSAIIAMKNSWTGRKYTLFSY